MSSGADNLRAENARLREEVTSCGRQIVELAAERDRFRTALLTEQERHRETRSEWESCSERIGGAWEEIKSLRAELHRLEVDVRSAHNDRDRIAAEREALRLTAESAQRDLDHWKTMYAAARSIVDSQTSALAALRQQNADIISRAARGELPMVIAAGDELATKKVDGI